MRQWLSLWGPPLLIMTIIFLLSGRPHIPGPSDPLLDLLLKKGAHMTGYGLLAYSYARALHGSAASRAGPLALLLALLYAISDEWHQSFVPGRDGNPLDVLIDLCGSLLGILLWQRFHYRNQIDTSP